MANPHRGAVALKAGDQDYTLSYSFNALCELEAALDSSIAEIIAMMRDGAKVRLGTIRTLVWVGLRDHHPDMDEAEAGRVITDAGTAATMEKVNEAFRLAFPQAEGAAKANPRRAKARG